MLPSKTVFIVGAGASFEAGMPVGTTLRETISTKLDIRFDDFGSKFVGTGDRAIFESLDRKYGQKINFYLGKCWQIRDGIILSPSVDDFINAHQHDAAIAECGKIAISRSILEAERRSKLFYEKRSIRDTINFKSIADSWYGGFYQLLSQGVTKGNLDSIFENVTIISFNYDRCIEHYLVHAIAAHYQIPIEAASKLVESLTIFHPYGSVGRYFGVQQGRVEFGFGGTPNIDDVLSNLKTFTEKTEDAEGLNSIRKAIVDAEVLVFLGNAFHPINTELLIDETFTSTTVSKRIFATRKGISDADLNVVRKQLFKLCGLHSHIPFVESVFNQKTFFADTCSHLFNEYRMSLRQ
jgi:hypothetical protein